MDPSFAKIAYLIASVLFILGLKQMTHPRTAVRGNMLGAAAMLLAMVVTFFDPGVKTFGWITAGLAIGGIIGAILATRIQMTDMPQLVALFNGFGGIASTLVAGAELIKARSGDGPVGSLSIDVMIATALSGIIGAVTFWGSSIAFGKLQELKVFKKPIAFPGQQPLNAILAIGLIGLTFWLVSGQSLGIYVLLVVIASILGVLLVTPIGGADMPVVIALLNSYSGLAAAATGFVINKPVLIITGSLVGASGIILTKIMCKAMNRSLTNVLFGVMDGGSSTGPDADEVYATVRSTSADDVAMILDTAQRVVIVPGYGMAVAQAQHAVRDLSNLLEANDTVVEYAIHPVAGRMPGHMNVLLAEANVPYDLMVEMDDINTRMEMVDVAIVIGANDVVNPAARDDENSPIYGMPIINVDKARTVFVLKRSMASGFAGVDNPLFFGDNTRMLFGDAKASISGLVAEFKS